MNKKIIIFLSFLFSLVILLTLTFYFFPRNNNKDNNNSQESLTKEEAKEEKEEEEINKEEIEEEDDEEEENENNEKDKEELNNKDENNEKKEKIKEEIDNKEEKMEISLIGIGVLLIFFGIECYKVFFAKIKTVNYLSKLLGYLKPMDFGSDPNFFKAYTKKEKEEFSRNNNLDIIKKLYLSSKDICKYKCKEENKKEFFKIFTNRVVESFYDGFYTFFTFSFDGTVTKEEIYYDLKNFGINNEEENYKYFLKNFKDHNNWITFLLYFLSDVFREIFYFFISIVGILLLSYRKKFFHYFHFKDLFNFSFFPFKKYSKLEKFLFIPLILLFLTVVVYPYYCLIFEKYLYNADIVEQFKKYFCNINNKLKDEDKIINYKEIEKEYNDIYEEGKNKIKEGQNLVITTDGNGNFKPILG